MLCSLTSLRRYVFLKMLACAAGPELTMLGREHYVRVISGSSVTVMTASFLIPSLRLLQFSERLATKNIGITTLSFSSGLGIVCMPKLPTLLRLCCVKKASSNIMPEIYLCYRDLFDSVFSLCSSFCMAAYSES